MVRHTITDKGSRYFVFNEDDYNSSGGLFDCELVTDDFKEAEQLAIRLSKQEFYPSYTTIFDSVDKKCISYFAGKFDKKLSSLIKFDKRIEKYE